MARFGAVSGDILELSEVGCIKLDMNSKYFLKAENKMFVFENKVNNFSFSFINVLFASSFGYSK